MQWEFKQKILDDLKKTGFPSEFEVKRILRQHGARWDCTNTMGYFDLDEAKLREVDLYAYMPCGDRVSKTAYTHTVWTLVIEVKKSEKPWIVFTERRDLVREVFRWRKDFASYRFLPAEWEKNFQWLIYENSLCKGLDWIGTNVHEAFNKSPDFSRAHGALISVVKAAEHFHKEAEQMMGDSPKVADDISVNTTNVFFIRPVLIFDGELLAAETNNDGEVFLNEIEMAPMHVNYKTTAYTRENYRVDLVKLSAFDKYLCTAEAQHDTIRKAILRHGGFEGFTEQELLDGRKPERVG
jgi:hypothetical protein